MKLRILISMMFLLIVVPVFAQEDAVNPSELELSGTPSEICEAATPAIEPENRSYPAAEDVLETGIDYRAIICTSAGAIYLDLYEDFAPATINNFVFLAEENYYNNTIFHRVLENFMAQAGDPTGTGAGGPGYSFQDEFVGFLSFDRPGLFAMANSGPATNGSQFFITTAPTPHLNNVHTIFGEVLEGQADVVDNILLRDPSAGGDSTSLDAVVIIRDPESVLTTFEETAEVATVDTFVEGLNGLAEEGVLPPNLTFEGAESLNSEDVASRVQEDLQEGYATFLETYGHDYRVSALIEDTECNAEFIFTMLSYTVDAFDSADSATEALADDFLPGYYEAVGYTAIETGDAHYNAYTAPPSGCAEDGIALTLDIQRGRYVANVSVMFTTSIVEQVSEADLAEITATSITALFESLLGGAYQSELR